MHALLFTRMRKERGNRVTHRIVCAVRNLQDTCQDAAVLVGPPERVVVRLQERLEWLESITEPNKSDALSSLERARFAYAELMATMVSGLVYGRAERSVTPKLGGAPKVRSNLNRRAREGGEDWTYLGDTMSGMARLDNVRDLIETVVSRNIPGDYIETGVWRGGSSLFARSSIRARGQGDARKSYVCDSFRGLPPGIVCGMYHVCVYVSVCVCLNLQCVCVRARACVCVCVCISLSLTHTYL